MLELINKLVWAVATALIFISGIYFTFKLKGVQFQFKEMFKNLGKKEKNNKIKYLRNG